MAVLEPIRTWDGNYGGDWFGSPYPWFGRRLGAAARGYLIERAECDCCYANNCHCTNCETIGYWNEYEVELAVPHGYNPPSTVGTLGISAAYAYFLLTGPRTFTLSTTYNNAGNVNSCCAIYEDSDIEFTYDGTDYLIYSLQVIFCPNHVTGASTFGIIVGEPWVGVPGAGVVWVRNWEKPVGAEEDCLGGITLDPVEPLIALERPQVLDWYYGASYPGSDPISVTVNPAAGAVWKSCGTDDTGAPIVDPGGEGPMSVVSALPQFEAASIGGKSMIVRKRTALPVSRAQRCNHFEGRTEFKPGCNGFRCKGKCDLGLPAVPGKYCQTCEKYEPDPDYMGQGVPGWLK